MPVKQVLNDEGQKYMNYIENIYICIAAPLIMAIIALRGRRRRALIFMLAGMTTCLLSSYISTFFAIVTEADRNQTTWEITPMIEEVMKFLPILFYTLIFEPSRKEEIAENVILVAIGFATLENICYLTANGASEILLLIIRGFGTGAMHVVCGILVSAGMVYLWEEFWLKFAGTVGLISLASTYHAIYNLLVSQDRPIAWIGYAIPLLTALLVMTLRGRWKRV